MDGELQEGAKTETQGRVGVVQRPRKKDVAASQPATNSVQTRLMKSGAGTLSTK